MAVGVKLTNLEAEKARSASELPSPKIWSAEVDARPVAACRIIGFVVVVVSLSPLRSEVVRF